MNYLHTSKKDFKRYSMLALFKNCIRAYCIWMFYLLAKITKYQYLSLCFNHHPAKEVSRKSISAYFSIQIQLWRTYSISHSHVREAIRLIGKLQPILPRSFVKPDLNTDEKNRDQVFNESFHRYIECI